MSWHSGPPQHPGALAESEHVCPLAPITEAEAVLALIDAMRAGSASGALERLEAKGLRMGRWRR